MALHGSKIIFLRLVVGGVGSVVGCGGAWERKKAVLAVVIPRL